VVELDEEPSGVLRLTAPTDLGATLAVAELLTAFRARWPAVRLEVELTPRVVDLVHEGVDLALRPSALHAPVAGEGVTVRRLATVSAQLYAAPAYLARRGTPTTPRELAEHDWVIHAIWLRRGIRVTHQETGEEVALAIEPVVTSNDIAQIHRLVVAGAGIGALPAMVTGADCPEGRLIPLLPEWSMPSGRLNAVWPTTRHLSPRVRAFVDFAAAWFASDPPGPPG
jgi:DNA-binding transcriptional LysR family regulator